MLEQLNTDNYRSLVDMFLQACRDYPDRVAYTSLGRDVSFREIERMSRSFAAFLPEVLAVDDEGWFRTGDIASIRADGYIRICDRLKDMILVSGFKVYPNEIEAVVSSHPAVLECAAVGVPGEKT